MRRLKLSAFNDVLLCEGLPSDGFFGYVLLVNVSSHDICGRPKLYLFPGPISAVWKKSSSYDVLSRQIWLSYVKPFLMLSEQDNFLSWTVEEGPSTPQIPMMICISRYGNLTSNGVIVDMQHTHSNNSIPRQD